MNKLEELKVFMKKLKKCVLCFLIIEFICTLIIGISANHLTEWCSFCGALLVFCSIFLLVILFCRFSYDKFFPETLVEAIQKDCEAIQKDCESQQLNSEYGRLIVVNDSIKDSLISLNAQTCGINLVQPVCNTTIKDGLICLLNGFLKRLHAIANTGVQSEFTVGVCLLSEPDCVYILKDELRLTEKIHPLNTGNLRGFELEVQSCLISCKNNGKPQFDKFKNSNLTMHTNIIPEVCSEEVTGLLFIIGDNFECAPKDFDDITSIHNRIITNLVSQYEKCNNCQCVRQLHEFSPQITTSI